ncbi:MAG: cytochrome c oxidase assembly protein subunit 15 [Bacteroidia bacterium]
MSIIGIIILFFLGGIVRITGAGMGCPDWPKCFGTWVPPTSVDQLPDNYEKEYLEKRKIKVSRLAKLLQNIGWTQKAEALLLSGDNSTTEAFNVRKTYTEYVNRLWGAITGILTLLAAVSSFQFWKSKKAITLFTWLGVLFVVFNGWLGSVVVDTDLLGGVVSLHFVLAFVAIASFMIAFYWNKTAEGKTSKSITALSVTGLAISLTQLLSGTAVREKIDHFGKSGVLIDLNNFELLGRVFNIHRLLAIGTGIILIALYIRNKNTTKRPKTSLILLAAIVMVIIQSLTGILNIRFAFPDVAQITHVTLGSLTLVTFIYLTIQEFKSKALQYVN